MKAWINNIKSKIKNIDTQDITFKIWKSFAVFTLVIIFFLWLIQGVFFQSYYEIFKKKDTISVANKISKKITDNNIQSIVDDLAYETSSTIFITDSNNQILISSLSSVKQNNSFININLIEDNRFVILEEQKTENKVFVYTKTVNDIYKVVVTTPVKLVTSTSKILSNQLFFICLTLLVMGFIISYYMSKKLSKPIKKITEKSLELAKGNYNIQFDGMGYTEVENLSKTLNYATRELARTDNLRRELMANVSHDLRTPLTMIKSYSEMVMDLPYKKKERNEKLQIIIDETNRLNTLVDDIIDLSKLESDVDKLELKKINISALLKSIIKRFNYLEEKNKYIIEQNIEDDLITKVDIKKISQVFYNLIGNAINYTSSDKRITINLTSDNKNILFEVIDYGKGIKNSDINKIWDKYFRVNVNYKRNIVGTGLGLNIVKNILVAHNLKYGVKSKEKEGSTFYIYFTNEKSL